MHRQAKLDALSALAVCAEAWGGPALERHVPSLWRGLRPELLAACTRSEPSHAVSQHRCLVKTQTRM